MQRIQLLYRIERKIKNDSPEQRHAVRQQRSLPELDDFRQWLDKHLVVVPPKSVLGKAMNYADRQWPKFIAYTLDGRLRIDNNLTENTIRPFVIGRKSQCKLIQPDRNSEGQWHRTVSLFKNGLY